jgi:hypothetical protein
MSDDESVMAGESYLEVGDSILIVGGRFGAAIGMFPSAGGNGTLWERKGDGPGEFRWIDGATASADEDTVVLVQEHRISYVGSDIRGRSVANPFPAQVGITILPDGALLLVSPFASSPQAARGFAVHLLDPVGHYRGSFYAAKDVGDFGRWPVAVAEGGRAVWIVQPRRTGFIAELWNIGEGHPSRVMRINPSWWQSPDEAIASGEQHDGASAPKPPSGTVGVWQNGDILFVALRHYDSKYAGADTKAYAPHKTFDGVLLAVEISSAKVLAVRRYDEFIFGFTNRGKLVLYDEDAQSRPRVQLTRVALRR